MSDYKAENISVLEGLEAVRKRPGMYIGSTGIRGLHHMVYEVVDNSIDEALAGHCDTITVVLHKDGSVTVKDNGRGIPTDMHPQLNMSALTVVLTKLHAGGKFDNDSYKVSGGLHGVGISVVNALSSALKVTVHRNGSIVEQELSRGAPVTEATTVGTTDISGTHVRFTPDADIFDTVKFNFDTLSARLRELAFLNKGITISITEEESEKEENYYYEGGIISFVEFINEGKDIIHEPIFIQGEKQDVSCEVCVQYNSSYNEQIFSFANNINTIEGGFHLSGFKSALTRAMNAYIAQSGTKEDIKVTSDDMREGLTCVLSVKISDPQFEGQTKTKLGNAYVQGIVSSLVYEGLTHYFETHPQQGKAVIVKLLQAAKAREAARKARELIRKKDGDELAALSGKLVPATSKNPEDCELFLVEGDSAGGTAKSGRDRKFQAILPLRGKIMNVEKAHLSKILSSKEIATIIAALGTGIRDQFNLDKLRYHKIIIMTDSDVDGAHISTLLLTLFYRYFRELIESGHVYVAQPPLYSVKKGKKTYYAQDDADKDRYLEKVGDNAIVTRFKGLGEMDFRELWETTMDPATRTLKQVGIGDAVMAEKVFTMLMGDDVEPRRDFIQDNATLVEHLDV